MPEIDLETAITDDYDETEVTIDESETLRITNILRSAFNNVSGDTWQDKLDTLAKCKCCERHQINKPTIFAPWINTTFHGTQYTPCECKCRHIARFICRQATE